MSTEPRVPDAPPGDRRPVTVHSLAEMKRRHEYSRKTDSPSLVFDKVEKLAESRARVRQG